MGGGCDILVQRGGLKDDTYYLISVGVRAGLFLKWHYDEM